MILWLSHRLRGYLLVILEGYSPERFFNLCSANAIEVWGLSCSGDRYHFYMTVEGFRKIRPFARKSKVRLRIRKKSGLPFFLYRNRRRKLFFGGLAGFFLILYGMSLFIWDIEFNGNHMYTYDTLIRFFESKDIQFGMLKHQVDCDVIEEALRTEFSEITWVSARVSGTRLLVQIKENEVLSSVPEKDETPCDLVAEKAGVVTGMVVRSGVPKVKIGERVEAGQILVSGVLPITDDGDTVVNTHYVRSDADIYATTEYNYEKSYPKLLQVSVKTGKKRRGVYLKLADFSMMLIRPRPKDTKWKIKMEEQQWKLFQNFYLPIYTGSIIGEEYITYERMYTEEEKSQLAETVKADFQKNLLEKGVQILENNVKILDNGSYLRVAGHMTANEKIGQNQRIQQPEETENVDERN